MFSIFNWIGTWNWCNVVDWFGAVESYIISILSIVGLREWFSTLVTVFGSLVALWVATGGNKKPNIVIIPKFDLFKDDPEFGEIVSVCEIEITNAGDKPDVLSEIIIGVRYVEAKIHLRKAILPGERIYIKCVKAYDDGSKNTTPNPKKWQVTVRPNFLKGTNDFVKMDYQDEMDSIRRRAYSRLSMGTISIIRFELNFEKSGCVRGKDIV